MSPPGATPYSSTKDSEHVVGYGNQTRHTCIYIYPVTPRAGVQNQLGAVYSVERHVVSSSTRVLAPNVHP
eukprot:8324108-Pyramimonas_sp.AAC.1